MNVQMNSRMAPRRVSITALLFAAVGTQVRTAEGAMVHAEAGQEVLCKVWTDEIEGSTRLYYVHRRDDPSQDGSQTVTDEIRQRVSSVKNTERAHRVQQAEAVLQALVARKKVLDGEIAAAQDRVSIAQAS